MIFTSSLSLRWSREFLRLADLLINTKNYIISNSTFLSRFSNFLHLFSSERLKSFSSSSLALPINISLSKSKSDLLTFSQLSHSLGWNFSMKILSAHSKTNHLPFSSSPGECWDYDDDNDDDESIILSTNFLCVKFKIEKTSSFYVYVCVCVLLLINLFIIINVHRHVLYDLLQFHSLKISMLSLLAQSKEKYDTRLNLIIIKWERNLDWVFLRKNWADKRWMEMRRAFFMSFVIDKRRVRKFCGGVIVKGWSLKFFSKLIQLRSSQCESLIWLFSM